MSTHVVQSAKWSEFKTKYGTNSVRSGDIFYTKHKIPFSPYYYAYCPKVDPNKIDFELVKKSLTDNNCIAINFDVPNVLTTDPRVSTYTELFTKHCVRSKKDTFARHNILLNLVPTEDELLANMHHKHRYNIKYSQKNGVVVREGTTVEDFENFFKLLSETATRQKYYIHPKAYYKLIWDTLSADKSARIMTAYKDGAPLASWMLFVYEGVLYYPYGGSSELHKNLAASTLLAWECIKLGKSLDCTEFDMWGASENPDDTSDPWYGFTNFKLRFGGRLVEYMNSYDFVINEVAYNTFNIANDLRWKILRFIK